MKINKKIKALNKIEKPVVTFSKSYCRNIDFRTMIKAIPAIGGYLDNLFAYKGSKIIQERTDTFFMEIADSLKRLEVEKIDKDFLDNEDAFYLFQKIYENIIRSNEKRKIRYFRNIFINSIQKEKSSYYFKERFINMVSDLSVLHVEIIKLYIDNEKLFGKEDLAANSFTLKNISEKLSISETQVEAFCNDLLRYNLLYDYRIGTYDYERGHFRITSNAADFIDFVISEV